MVTGLQPLGTFDPSAQGFRACARAKPEQSPAVRSRPLTKLKMWIEGGDVSCALAADFAARHEHQPHRTCMGHTCPMRLVAYLRRCLSVTSTPSNTHLNVEGFSAALARKFPPFLRLRFRDIAQWNNVGATVLLIAWSVRGCKP